MGASPSSKWEQQAFNMSNTDVYPDDVRADFEQYKDTTVAWVGIIEKYQVVDAGDHWEVGYFCKHHYYDWVEDFVGKRPIKLSQKGEGYFVAYWAFRKSADIEAITTNSVGSMLIAYGNPDLATDDGLVELSTLYLRQVDPQFVDRNWLQYDKNSWKSVVPQLQ